MSEELKVKDRMEQLEASPAWREFLVILEDHKVELQKDSNEFLRKGDARHAGNCLARLDDVDKWIRLFKDKLKGLGEKHKQ